MGAREAIAAIAAGARIPTPGFPLAVGVCIAGFALVSMTLLRETPHPLRVLGICLTLGGVVLLGL